MVAVDRQRFVEKVIEKAIVGTLPSSALDELEHIVADNPRAQAVFRLLDKIIVQPNGCWKWIGARNPKNYGSFWLDGHMVNAHRAAYKLLRDPNLPDEHELDHQCPGGHNRWCINPWHTVPMSHTDNTLRNSSPPAVNARKTHCPRHELTSENLLAAKDGARRCRPCKALRTRRKKAAATYRCQFCEKSSPRKQWKDDRCPKCGAKYDATLAQEGDEG
jgi:hypothetical protein